jgi:hypothetical protein
MLPGNNPCACARKLKALPPERLGVFFYLWYVFCWVVMSFRELLMYYSIATLYKYYPAFQKTRQYPIFGNKIFGDKGAFVINLGRLTAA